MTMCSLQQHIVLVFLGFTLPCDHDETDQWRTGIWLHSGQVQQLASLQGNHKLNFETTTK